MGATLRGATALPIVFALTAAAAPPGPTRSQTVQSYDAYKSWFVACDNTLDCVARGFEDGGGQSEIEIERTAGPSGKISASISSANIFKPGAVTIDGKPAGLSAPAWHFNSDKDDGAALTTDNLAAVQALVARLRDASKVSLGGDDNVPLDGFAAAMLRLDERQGRIGGVTALAKRGPAPAAQVPPAPPLPLIPNHPIKAVLTKAEEQRLITSVRASQQAVLKQEDCEANPGAMEPDAYALDDGRALVLIPCIMGAYQGSSIGFIAPRKGGPAKRLVLPTPYLGNDPARSAADMLTESDFDPKTGSLTMVAKGRGIADCGFSASWIWDGNAFRLSDMSLQEACGGAAPGEWPTLFQSKQ
jgi:hypothetical protein